MCVTIDTYAAAAAAQRLLEDYQAASETWHWHELAAEDWTIQAATKIASWYNTIQLYFIIMCSKN